MIIVHKCNILLMDFNGDCCGIVYFYQIVMDINMNVLNNTTNYLNVFFIVSCIILLIMIGYQIKLNKFVIVVDYTAVIIKFILCMIKEIPIGCCDPIKV